MFSIKKDTLRRGEYRNYTFRMPAHVPELTFSIVAERGCVCFYASNCSERPNARMCQWTLLVDAEKQESGLLTVRTSEHHYLSGAYHVGLYCIADSAFSLACSTTQSAASDVLKAMAAKQKPRAGVGAITEQLPSPRSQLSSVRSPEGRRSQMPPSVPPLPAAANRAKFKPFIDEGILEASLSARASDPRRAQSPREPPRNGGYKGGGIMSLVDPGEMHHDQVLGEWHRSLRGVIEARAPDSLSLMASPRSPRRGPAASEAKPAAKVLGSLQDAVSSWGRVAQPVVPLTKPPAAAMPPAKRKAPAGVHMPGPMTPAWIGGHFN